MRKIKKIPVLKFETVCMDESSKCLGTTTAKILIVRRTPFRDSAVRHTYREFINTREFM